MLNEAIILGWLHNGLQKTSFAFIPKSLSFLGWFKQGTVPFWPICPMNLTWSSLRVWWSPSFWTLWRPPLLQQKQRYLLRPKRKTIHATTVSLSQSRLGHLHLSRTIVSRPFLLRLHQVVHLKLVRSVVVLLESVYMRIRSLLFPEMTVISRKSRNSKWIFEISLLFWLFLLPRLRFLLSSVVVMSLNFFFAFISGR